MLPLQEVSPRLRQCSQGVFVYVLLGGVTDSMSPTNHAVHNGERQTHRNRATTVGAGVACAVRVAVPAAAGSSVYQSDKPCCREDAVGATAVREDTAMRKGAVDSLDSPTITACRTWGAVARRAGNRGKFFAFLRIIAGLFDEKRRKGAFSGFCDLAPVSRRRSRLPPKSDRLSIPPSCRAFTPVLQPKPQTMHASMSHNGLMGITNPKEYYHV